MIWPRLMTSGWSRQESKDLAEDINNVHLNSTGPDPDKPSKDVTTKVENQM